MNKLEQAIKSYENKEFHKALTIFQELAVSIDDTPENFKIYNYLGLCYLGLEDFDKALKEFEQASYYFDDSTFIDNLLVTSHRYYNKIKDDKDTSYYAPVHYLRQYVSNRNNDYKRDVAYRLLGFFSDLEAFNEQDTLKYFEKAFFCNAKSKNHKIDLEYIKEKIESSLLGNSFILPANIIKILDKLKKSCQVITSFFDEEIENEHENIYYLFAINNTKEVNLPKEINRLEVYFDEDEYKVFYKIINDKQNLQENIVIENEFNLPDLATIEEKHQEEFNELNNFFQSLQTNENYDTDNAYNQLVKKYLGHSLYPTFIGGNLNQMYVELDNDKELNFLMQYQTDWSNGEIVFIFNKKENPLDLTIIVQH